MLADIALAIRSFRRSPGFALAAVLTLAMGIGATSTVFTLVNAVLLEALPYRDPQRLLLLRGEMRREGNVPYPLSVLDVQSLGESATGFEEIVPVSSARPFNLAADGEVEHVTGEMVGDGFFRVLGVPVVLGRSFTREESGAPGSRVVVLGHDLWSRRFGADRDVLGTTILLNDAPYEIIGVAAPRFTGLSDEAKLWLPIGLAGGMYGPHYTEMREYRWISAVARLRPGVTPDGARRALEVASARLEREFAKENAKFAYVGETMADAYFGEQRRPLWSMMAAAGFVLLIACTNVANLLLARAAARRQEIGVRLALGASRARLVRQSVAESLTLMAAGALLGLGIAGAGARAIVASGAVALPSFRDAGLDPLVIGVTLGIALASTLLFTIAPAVLATRVAPSERLGDGGKGSTMGRSRMGFQRGLIVAEVAVAVALLAGAGLMRKGFVGYVSSDLGFRGDSVLSLRLDLTSERFRENDAMWALLRRLTEETRALPGVTAAAIEGPGYPTSGWFQAHVTRADDASPEPEQLPARRHHVTPGYFATLGIALVEGRDFGAEDVAGTPRTIIVSRAFAERAWPGVSAVGRRLKTIGPTPAELLVVGVAADVAHNGRRQEDRDQTDLYLPAYQSPPRSPSIVTLLVRHRGTSASLLAPLRATMKRIDAALPFYDVRPVAELLAEQTATARFLVRLMTMFALVGLALAAVGVYGVISYGVARRARDIGIRVALGATRSRIAADVVAWGLRPVGVGVALGLIAVGTLHRFVSAMLYGVDPLDPATLVAAIATLVVVALGACLVPARRAARVDPLVALRGE